MNASFRALILVSICVAAAPRAGADSGLDPSDVAFFENKVRPLLVRHCYECHSAEAKEVKGGLYLDSKQGWEKGGDSGTAVEPGNVSGSLLLTAVRYEDFEMPPKGKLPNESIAILEKWVERGAPDPRTGGATIRKPKPFNFAEARNFWAFDAPVAHDAPQIADVDWPRDDIDRFVLARLEAAKLKPAPDADAHTWLRRVTFDLTGLPPTLQEIDSFVADQSEPAREKVVDRLLGSPHFGRHWGRHWLDVARYADSNGSDFNATFYNAWRYRDYVVDAFNRDKPFDLFVREQLAGDLMPYENDRQRSEQLVATGFLMIGPKMLSERDKEKLLMDVADEQIDTVGRAFLGLTLGCARCHDHKFDPIPTVDYYALAGIFCSTETLYGESQQYVSAWREWDLPISDELSAQLAAHQKQRAEVKAALERAKKDQKIAQDKLDGKPNNLALGVIVDDTQAEIVGQWKASTYSPNYVGSGYVHDEKTEQGKKSVTFRADLPTAGEYEVRIAYPGTKGRASNVPIAIQHAGGVAELTLNQELTAPIDKLWKPLGRYHFNAGQGASLTLSNKATNGYVIADAVQFIPVAELDKKDKNMAAKSSAARDGEASAASQLHATLASLTKTVKELETELKKLDAAAPQPPKAMSVREAEKIDDCQVCIRGEHKNRGAGVPRGFLRVLSEAPRYVANPEQSGRRDLAQWIASPQNPLTARVMVNRIWGYLLGEGIVRSVDNFGHLGQRPTHPELLDRLAIDFVQDGWSMKRLIRRIVLSRAYGVSSQHNKTAIGIDPENKLLWRAHLKRLPAEAIRDSLLAISGKLDRTPGESPVEGLGKIAIDNSASQTGGTKTDGHVRRSIYLPIVRNDLPEMLTVFDFANPDAVTGRRATTTVPAQALLLMNDPFVRRCAEHTRDALLADTQLGREQRLKRVYLLMVGREPSEQEIRRAHQFLEQGPSEEAGWAELVQALFASTEFRMLN